MSFQIFKEKCNTTQKFFLFILGSALLLLSVNFLYIQSLSLVNISIYGILFLLFLLLGYIAYVDFKTMEIGRGISLFLMLFLLAVNLLLHFSLGSYEGLNVGETFSYIPYDNFVSALSLGAVFFLIVLISKEKALGAGDIRIAIIVGFLIGQGNLLLWLYITIFSALFYGLGMAYKKKKKLKGLKIPFAPFMILGSIVSVLIDLYL